MGKSYIVENFAKQEYKNYIIIDFNRVNKEVTDLFDNYLNDLDFTERRWTISDNI